MRIILTLILSSFLLLLNAQVELAYYLPQDQDYRTDVPTPGEVLGYEVGEWHTDHDQLLGYLKVIAEASDRLEIQTIGHTWERRPLVHVMVSSPENLARLEEIREDHLQNCDPDRSESLDHRKMPVVVNLGFSVHGDEASGSHAAMLVAYHLAASQSPSVQNWLDSMVIIIDPSLNPDGFERFTGWVNSHRSIRRPSSDPRDFEHQQPWPSGRTNHYWFDLNRDWVPAQHPESQARLKAFHRWKPNFLTDHHEMGRNRTFFFQPGIPSRNNPLSPARVFEISDSMAKYHARALDSIGSLYYSEESFDDFYYGKGSTYPDINGSVGILFEQAGVEGQVVNTINGLLTFPFAIRNQFNTALSTLGGCYDLRMELLDHQRQFFQEARSMARKQGSPGWIFGQKNDPRRAWELAAILRRHDIEVYSLTKDITINGDEFINNTGFVVPFDQPQYRLIEALFERRTTFRDSLFYDVSAWTLPLAFNVDHQTLPAKSDMARLAGELVDPKTPPTGSRLGESDYAYALEWAPYYAPRALYRLQEAGLRVRVATRPFNQADQTFERGTLILPLAGQPLDKKAIEEILAVIVEEDGLTITGLPTGLTGGLALGSPQVRPIEKPRVLLLVGGNISGYEAGEVWHLLDARMKMPVTLLPLNQLGPKVLDDYNTLVMVGGNYGGISEATINRLRDWVTEGGVVIGIKYAARWLAYHNIGIMELVENSNGDPRMLKPYIERKNADGAQRIGGAICEAKMDLTHPLTFGFENPKLSIFRNSTLFMKRTGDPFGNPVMYTENPLQAGYISEENQKALANSAALTVTRQGSGRVILMTDDPNFRAFWYGTNRLFLNAIFFGRLID